MARAKCSMASSGLPEASAMHPAVPCAAMFSGSAASARGMWARAASSCPDLNAVQARLLRSIDDGTCAQGALFSAATRACSLTA